MKYFKFLFPILMIAGPVGIAWQSGPSQGNEFFEPIIFAEDISSSEYFHAKGSDADNKSCNCKKKLSKIDRCFAKARSKKSYGKAKKKIKKCFKKDGKKFAKCCRKCKGDCEKECGSADKRIQSRCASIFDPAICGGESKCVKGIEKQLSYCRKKSRGLIEKCKEDC